MSQKRGKTPVPKHSSPLTFLLKSNFLLGITLECHPDEAFSLIILTSCALMCWIDFVLKSSKKSPHSVIYGNKILVKILMRRDICCCYLTLGHAPIRVRALAFLPCGLSSQHGEVSTPAFQYIACGLFTCSALA